MAYVNFGRKNTRAEALISKNKDKIFFPTDSNSIILGGREFGKTLSLGETTDTAFAGDRGKTLENNITIINKDISNINTQLTNVVTKPPIDNLPRVMQGGQWVVQQPAEVSYLSGTLATIIVTGAIYPDYF